jgi:hypothetical protein
MSDATSMRDRCLGLIDRIVDTTLKGKIRSKEQVYRMLVREVAAGTGEIFERCLNERLTATEGQLNQGLSELKEAKINRILRALKTIEGEWERWQKENQTHEAIAQAAQQIINADPEHRLEILLKFIDPNQAKPFTLEQLQQLGKTFAKSKITDPETTQQIAELNTGIQQGLEAWQRVEPNLVSWMYDQGRSQLGFEGTPEQRGPWAIWAKSLNPSLAKTLFHTLAYQKSLSDIAKEQSGINPSDLVALTLVLQCLQRGLVTWFDKLIYDSKVGAKLSISTFLTFAVIWSQLANGFNQSSGSRWLADTCFQVTLQIFREFSQQPYFPLYGEFLPPLVGHIYAML